jgi:VanZ family protein
VWVLLFGVSVAVVLFATMTPITIKPMPFPHLDKLEHAIAFSGLTVLGMLAWPTHGARVAAALLGYGALIEVLQGTLTRTRSASLLDWVADALGVAAGWWLASRLVKRAPAN